MQNREVSFRSGFAGFTRALGTGVFVLQLASLATGCSGSDSRPRYVANVSGAPATTPVSQLSSAQAQQICQSYDAYVNTYVDLDAVAYIACLPLAIFTTTTPDACNISLKNCMAIFPKPIQVSAKANSVQVCASSLSQCQATVGQLESCVNVSVDQGLAVFDTWSCNMAGNPMYKSMVQPSGALVNVCTDINAACNKFAQVGPQ